MIVVLYSLSLHNDWSVIRLQVQLEMLLLTFNIQTYTYSIEKWNILLCLIGWIWKNPVVVVGGGSHTLHYPALFLTPLCAHLVAGRSREIHGSGRVQMLPWFLSRPVSDQSRRVEAPHLVNYTALFSGVMMHNPTRHSRLIPDSGRVLGIEFVFILCWPSIKDVRSKESFRVSPSIAVHVPQH